MYTSAFSSPSRAPVRYQRSQPREARQVFALQLGRSVQAVNVRRRVPYQDVVVSGVSQFAIEARQRRRRFSRPARPGDQHPAPGQPDSRGVHRLEFQILQPPVKDRAQREARFPVRNISRIGGPVDALSALAIDHQEHVRAGLVHGSDALRVESGDLSPHSVAGGAPGRSGRRHSCPGGVEDQDREARLLLKRNRQRKMLQRGCEQPLERVPREPQQNRAVADAVGPFSRFGMGGVMEALAHRVEEFFRSRPPGSEIVVGSCHQFPEGSWYEGHPASSTSWMGSSRNRSCMSL